MRYEKLISDMTLEEKAALTSGKGFWDSVNIQRLGIPSIKMSDGPHGIRKQAGDADHLGLNKSVPATCFPTAASMANTWNPALGEAVGQYLGKEAMVQGINVLLGPGLNIKRSPLCGRNFEYFSEDPYLAGKMAAGYVIGIQSEGVAACPKHYAVNSQELRRMHNDSVLDERTLREIYTTGFEIAVKEGEAMTIMSAYNKVNGIYANEHEHLLRGILVDEWGFDGFVISDWGASNDHALGVANGSHLEMPTTGKDGIKLIVDAVKSGKLDESVLDERLDEFLSVVFRLKEAQATKNTPSDFDIEDHHVSARKAAEECIVLLKNEEEILPIKSNRKIGIIGDFAKDTRYQGAGSSLVNPTKLDNALEAWKKTDAKVIGYEQGFERHGKSNSELIFKAVALAKKSDVVLMYLGLDEVSESEGRDRDHMKMPENQVAAIEAVAEVNPNIIVILSAGAAVEMPWIDQVKGLIHGYLLGQAGSESLVNVVLGNVCPSGRLAESYPLKLEDTPCHSYYPGTELTSEYREGVFVGYRYYETAEVPVLFPFGFGLSYTEFSFDALKVTEHGVIVDITNVGDVAGAEVIQMYISKAGTKIYRPVKELKGFSKVYLQPGASIQVEIPFDDKTFRYYNTGTNSWEVEGGTYQVMIGASVADIRLQGEIQVEGTAAQSPYDALELKDYYKGNIKNIDDAQFQALLGRALPVSKWDTSKPLNLNDTVGQMFYAKSFMARIALKIIAHIKDNSIKKGKPNLNILFIYDIPFRGIAKMMGGAISMEMAEGILEMVNGHGFKGIKKLIKGAMHKNVKTEVNQGKNDNGGVSYGGND